MNARIAVVLLVLLAVLGGGALLIRQQAGSQKPAGSEALGQPLLKGLQAADVASIVIRQPKGALTIAKQDDRWVIAERDGFPADFDKVRDFVLKAIALKVGQSEPIGEQDRARLNLDASGTAVEFLGAGGKPLARLALGRKYFKAEPENPDKAIGDGRYVALPEDAKRVIVVSDRISAFDVVLGTIPFKGQVLNQMAAHWFELTKDLVPNHVLSVPDPTVMVATECTLLPVEFVMRAYITGVTSTSRISATVIVVVFDVVDSVAAPTL